MKSETGGFRGVTDKWTEKDVRSHVPCGGCFQRFRQAIGEPEDHNESMPLDKSCQAVRVFHLVAVRGRSGSGERIFVHPV